jgi:hypothetical protein
MDPIILDAEQAAVVRESTGLVEARAPDGRFVGMIYPIGASTDVAARRVKIVHPEQDPTRSPKSE